MQFQGKFQAKTKSIAMLAEFHAFAVSQEFGTCLVYEQECITPCIPHRNA